MDSRFADSDSIIGYKRRKTREVKYPIQSRDDGLCIFELRGEERDENLYYESLERTSRMMSENRTNQTGGLTCPESIFQRQRRDTGPLTGLASGKERKCA